jgi:hypothetical protein
MGGSAGRRTAKQPPNSRALQAAAAGPPGLAYAPLASPWHDIQQSHNRPRIGWLYQGLGWKPRSSGPFLC